MASQKITSTMLTVVMAGMCMAVLLTAGRTAGVEQEVLKSIDSAGTRSVIIRGDPDSGLNASVLTRIKSLEGVEWAGAFSSAVDARNAQILDGNPVPVRELFTTDLRYLGLDSAWAVEDTAFASSDAVAHLGMVEASGGLLAVEASRAYGLGGNMRVPDFLEFMEPLVLVPGSPEDERWRTSPVGLLVVVAKRADLVVPVAATVAALLGVEDINKVSLETSEQLAALQSVVQQRLSSYSNGLVMGIFLVTAVLVAAVFSTLVLIKRKEFGRRRALGATRTFISNLLICQSAVMSLAGSVLGSVVSAFVLSLDGAPQPPIKFYCALVVIALLLGAFAVMLPAVIASYRDPVRELRVP
ncbi:FtsX-like permease family protein [Paenarthrobacter sp. 4246]|uniref:ABC transporter permease n=1 Tax=Paenarthrobacter sp. 4246 TaxID=3156456 RepID=UPI003398B07C